MRLLFSVVIPTCNRISYLCSCLDCLRPYLQEQHQRELGYKIEIIVSDDGIDPKITEMLNLSFPWCRYETGPRRGPAANRNHGASVARGSWLVFTDDDCLPQPGWLESFARCVNQAVVLEGKTMACGRRNRVDQDSPINEMGGALLSCNFAIRADLFAELGGFNEVFPGPAMEDNELNARIKKLSLKKEFVHDALVLHPWRRRKGIDYQIVHAQSVAHFVRLHPEYKSYFSIVSQGIKLLRSIKSNSMFSLGSGIYLGLFRQLRLDFYNISFAWWFTRNLPLDD
jgi:glycosyltransferase involved in cell wall biosynthesis